MMRQRPAITTKDKGPVSYTLNGWTNVWGHASWGKPSGLKYGLRCRRFGEKNDTHCETCFDEHLHFPVSRNDHPHVQ